MHTMATSGNSDITCYVDNWQAGKTLAQCNLRMLQEEDSCDVTFRCGNERLEVKAHSYMLISRSCVFHAMFSGPMAEKSEVNIPDIEPNIFKGFLRYIYTDDTDVDSDHVTALLYTARKYAVSGLETKCTSFLETNLNVENACVILEAAHHFDQKELHEKALTLIKEEAERSLQSSGFLALSQVLVDTIVGSDDLLADEHVIFNAVNDWSEAECRRQKKGISPESKRLILGSTLMKVRFPLMKTIFFAEAVKESGLLTDSERIICYDYLALTKGDTTPFINRKRHSSSFTDKGFSGNLVTTKNRFVALRGYSCCRGLIDAISFSSSCRILIHGCQLYGKYQWQNKTTFKVTCYLGTKDNVLSSMVQDETKYTGDSEVFDMLFPRPVSVRAGEWYTLAVKIVGPDTWSGTGGQEKIVCDNGVEFSFRDSFHSENVTSTSIGQIPSLIFEKL